MKKTENMDPETLKLLLKEKENLTLEFKESFTTKIDEDIVAFSNTKGGVIILGVDDKGNIKGQELTNDIKAKINTLSRNCQPAIQVTATQFEKIIIIEVPEGNDKPYSCSDGYFRRLDGSTQKMTHEETRMMFEDNNKTPFESKTNNKCTLKDISKQKVKRYLEEAKITDTSQKIQDVLQSANMIEGDKIKNAGILFFAKETYKFLNQTAIDLIRFSGTDRVDIFDRILVQDDLLTQFDQAMFFLEKHLNKRSEIKGVNRKDKLEIPIEALREAVVNAIIHRDYSIAGTNISVEIYDDRVRIINPGYLAKGVSKDNFGKVSIRRNQIIADIFYRMDKIERAGTGIKRIKTALKEEGLKNPKFEFGSFFEIIFKRPSYEELKNKLAGTQKAPESDKGKSIKDVVETWNKRGINVVETEEKILQQILINSKTTISEIEKILKIPRRTIEDSISRLKTKGILERAGSRKTGYWKINL